jgi:CubicO group peptidase (beta-lactamase class C family)
MPLSLLGLAVAAAALLFPAGASRATDTPVYDIPRLAAFALDGDPADWADNGFRIDSFAPAMKPLKPADAFAASVRLAWNDDGLLMLVFWHDANWEEAATTSDISNHDSMEVFFARQPEPLFLVRWFVAPGMAANQPEPRTFTTDRRSDPDLLKLSADIKVARKANAGDCVLEALIPWAPLGVAPAMGTTVAFQVAFNDQEESDYYPVWTVEPGENSASLTPHILKLSDKASGPVTTGLRARGGYVIDRGETQVSIAASSAYAGKTAVIKDDEGRTLAKAEFKDNGPANTLAEATFAMPPVGKPYKTLSVEIDGKTEASLEMQDADALRAWAFLHQELIAQPAAVFDTDTFPAFEFATPDVAKALIGPYSIKASFYDNGYNPVTAASALGRYAAVIEITADSGKVYKRFMTLCRMTAEQAHKDLQKTINRKPLDTAVSPDAADPIHAAALHESKGGKQVSTNLDFYTNPVQIDRQWWVGLKRRLYGYDKRWPEASACPAPLEGAPAPVVREGTLAEAGMKPDADKAIDAVLTRWAGDTDESFAVCIVRHGVIVLHKAYGTRDGHPLTVDDKSWMASISKLMSGTLMMTFVDQGLVNLDDPVSIYLPALDGVTTNQPLTIRRLYNHTDGLDEHWGNNANDMEERIAALAPHLEVGKFYRYNGTGLELGGKVMEAISGLSLPSIFRARLLDPLGCAHTDVGSGSYDAGSVPLDMARIGQMLLNKGSYGRLRFMSPATFEAMLPLPIKDQVEQATSEQYGVGSAWAIPSLDSKAFGHGAASSATFIVAPTLDMVIVMTRNAAGNNFQRYNHEFFDILRAQIADPPSVESTDTQ